jgi:hypothetical protein
VMDCARKVVAENSEHSSELQSSDETSMETSLESYVVTSGSQRGRLGAPAPRVTAHCPRAPKRIKGRESVVKDGVAKYCSSSAPLSTAKCGHMRVRVCVCRCVCVCVGVCVCPGPLTKGGWTRERKALNVIPLARPREAGRGDRLLGSGPACHPWSIKELFQGQGESRL